MNKILTILILLFCTGISSFAGDQEQIKAGIDEQLGAYLPLDIKLFDENGKTVELKELLSKPTIIDFVYFDCPGICNPLMNELANVVNLSDLKPGVDYNILSISFDPQEDSKLALAKKNTYMQTVSEDFPSSSWRFLTSDSTNIKLLTDAAGFRFLKKDNDFVHAGALLFVTKDGMISRYLFPGYSDRAGFSILPFDFKMAVIETSKGKTIPTIAKMLQFCFSYDPEGRTYVFNFLKIIGGGMLLCVIAFVVFLVRPKKDKRGQR